MKIDKILMSHGSGGAMSNNLIKNIFLNKYGNEILNKLEDSAVLNIDNSNIAFSTDSYVVNPVFFPGGNIGKLAVCGTVNDLSMAGSDPLYIAAGLIIEEGFLLADLEKIVESMKLTAESAGVEIVTGDTKVVESGSADKIFINTSGIGLIGEGINVSVANARVGDKIIINGSIGDHGITILKERNLLKLDTNLKSDCAPLNKLVKEMLETEKNIHSLRDATRGGLAAVLNEISESSKITIKIYESKIPVVREVRSACEILGFDPLYIPNEGKLAAFVPPESADRILNKMKKNRCGKDAAIIGEVTGNDDNIVLIETISGGTRIVDMPVGEQLPRIC